MARLFERIAASARPPGPAPVPARIRRDGLLQAVRLQLVSPLARRARAAGHSLRACGVRGRLHAAQGCARPAALPTSQARCLAGVAIESRGRRGWPYRRSANRATATRRLEIIHPPGSGVRPSRAAAAGAGERRQREGGRGLGVGRGRTPRWPLPDSRGRRPGWAGR